METVDVVVIGGGPAGSAAAIALARAGRDVVLVDKAAFPRDKCCGDGLTTGALRQLEDLGLDPAAVASWNTVDACWVRSPSGRTVEFPFPDDGVFGAVARRVDLDAALLDLVYSSGAKVHEGHAMAWLEANEDGVTVGVDGMGPIAARYLVAADGMWSAVRKAVCPPLASLPGDRGYLGEWHAFRQYLRTPGDASRKLWVFFEPSLLPGYAWSFPLPGGISNVGFGIRRRSGEPTRSMGAAWRSLLEEAHIADVLGPGFTAEAPHKAWPIPARLPTTSVDARGGRILFVGDAARATDPMTGEGIGQALETARLAARAIDRGGPARPDVAAHQYRSTLRRGMAVDHRLANVLSRALQSPAGARGAVRIAGSSGWTRRNFARWLFEDYPRAMLATPHRWGPGSLRRTGAFRGARGGDAV